MSGVDLLDEPTYGRIARRWCATNYLLAMRPKVVRSALRSSSRNICGSYRGVVVRSSYVAPDLLVARTFVTSTSFAQPEAATLKAHSRFVVTTKEVY